MKKLASILLGSVLAASLAVIISCGRSEAPSKPSVEPNGLSAHLTRIDGPPIYSIEKVGDTGPPGPGIITISQDAQFAVLGWAVDRAAKVAAGGVDVVIDGKPYAAVYGDVRTDVADHFKIPAYGPCGFKFSVPAAAFDKGIHHFVVRVINSTKTAYWEDIPFAVQIQ